MQSPISFAVAAAAAVLATACASSSGVLPLGPDTYSISAHAAPARGGAPSARKSALSEASAHCSSLSKEVLVTNITTTGEPICCGVDVIFQCKKSGDPELAAPQYRKSPDVVIEDRRQ